MFEPSHKSSEEVHCYMQRIIRKHIWLYKNMFSLWLMLGEGVIPKQVHFLFSIPDCFNKILFVSCSLMTWSRNKVNIYLIPYTCFLHQRAPAFNFSSQWIFLWSFTSNEKFPGIHYKCFLCYLDPRYRSVKDLQCHNLCNLGMSFIYVIIQVKLPVYST